MKHLSEEQIVLHCYGDAENVEEVRGHLSECVACRDKFGRLLQLLKQIEPVEVPEPSQFFEEKTWLTLRDRLPAKRGGFRQRFLAAPRWAVAATVAVLLAAAFLAGRYGPRPGTKPEISAGTVNRQQVVLVAVGDHLERSQMLLVEIMNNEATTGVDLSSEQQQARDLLDANHLYRVSAQNAGDPKVAQLLDELGRVLTEIANSPSDMSPADLQQIRSRIQSDGLLFKVRIVGSEVNSRVRRAEQNPAGIRNQRL
ncbi:MAG TPA: hypothetical protein VIX19_09095 [Terriglobales bacterium]